MKRLALALWVLPLVALADVPPPNVEGCRDKKAGDSCTTDAKASGRCANVKCSRIAYGGDAGPRAEEYDCVQCTEGIAPAATDGTGGGKGGGCNTSRSSGAACLLGLALILGGRRPKRV